MPSRIQIAKPDILRFFNERPQKLYTSTDLSRVLDQQRSFWRLAVRTTVSEFIGFLLNHGLRRFAVAFPSAGESACYTWGDVPLMLRLQFLKPRSYYSHFTAMQRHGLTEQSPQTIYLTQPPSSASSRGHGSLTQAAIDAAFRKPVRISPKVAEIDGYRVHLSAGGRETGLIEQTLWDQAGEGAQQPPPTIRLTGIERTLIDAAVRPVYSGGVAEVLKAFSEAKNIPVMSVNRLRAVLKDLDFIYPYHQVLGFYLERAGYREAQLRLFRQIPQDFDFYLTHDMGETDFIPAWRLHVPRGF